MDRDDVLQLIVAQLQEYDHASIAQVVATATGLSDYSLDPSPRLAELLALGKRVEDGEYMLASDAAAAIANATVAMPIADQPLESLRPAAAVAIKGEPGLDSVPGSDDAPLYGKHLVFPEEPRPEGAGSVPFPKYSPGFAGKHSGPLTSAVYSWDGKFVATSAFDATIRVMDVDVLLDTATGRHRARGSEYAQRGAVPGEYEDGPVFKSLVETGGVVHDLSFHPSNMILASCSEDHQIRLYDVAKTASRKSFRYVSDSYPVYSIAFHPGGQFILAGTAHAALRMYDIQTFKCFLASPGSSDDNVGGVGNAITSVRIAADGRLAATASADGAVRLWDATSGKCTATWKAAHNGQRVTSLAWSKSGAYVLTGGTDGTVRLWEASSGRTRKAYYGASRGHTLVPRSGPATTLAPGPQACFSWDEQHIIATDEKDRVVAWDAITGNTVEHFDGVSPQVPTVRVAAGHTSPSILAFGDDGRFCSWGLDRDAS
ncbi:hypothetical protein H9P43_001092 [Blastocladiella emersonii ATCC 22665]|nr:hypothetical protein H9P43_001092 [Blastocladiella emersonii ATCC 22665]